MGRRALEVLRDDGAVSLWFKILGELGYRRVTVNLDLLEQELDLGASPLSITSSFLTEDQIEEYVEWLPGLTVEEIEARFADGQRCIVGRLDGQIIGRRWYMYGRARIEYLDLDLELADGTVYSYDVWVRPEVRRQGASTVQLAQSRELLAGIGVRVRMSVVMPENRAGLLFAHSYGMEAVGYLRTLRVGGHRRDWFQPRSGIDHRFAFHFAPVSNAD